METCVLIPAEFSLVLSPQTEDSNANRLYEMGVQVWSNQRIPKGEIFLPYQGTIRLDTLEVYSLLDDNDIRHRFGCYDDIREVDDRTVRHCNWIRFLRCSTTINSEVNLIGRLVHNNEAIYETLHTVLPNTEMVVYFETGRNTQELSRQRTVHLLTSTPINNRDANRLRCRAIEGIGNVGNFLNYTISPLSNRTVQNEVFRSPAESPLDLSIALISTPTSSSSSLSSPSAMDISSTPSAKLSRTSSSQLSSSGNADSLKMTAGEVQAANKKPRERTLLPCEYCGKAFDRPSLLRRHLRTHTGEKPHVCDVCGKGFSTSSSLNTHRRIHSGEKPHQCHICGKRFTASSNLYYHRMTHNKEKPHKCTLCSKSFPTPGDLKSHMYVHNGSWPFKCHVCNRGFSKQTNLRNHIFLHSGDRPHVCVICQKRFALACNLRAHLKTHEEAQPDKCQKCGKDSRGSPQGKSSSCECKSYDDAYYQNTPVNVRKVDLYATNSPS